MARHPLTTVVRAGAVWTGGPNGSLLTGDLVLEDGVVAGVEPIYHGRSDRELDAYGCLVLPGLINCHVHAGCSPQLRGIAEDIDLPAEQGNFSTALIPLLELAYGEWTDAELAAVIEWDAIAMLRGGATTIVEESFGGHSAWIELVGRLGFRSSLGLTYPGSVAAIGTLVDGAYVKAKPGDAALRGLEAGLRLHREHHGTLGGRLSIHLSPHAPDTVPEEVLRATRLAAGEHGTTIHLHLAQDLAELAVIDERYGCTPVEHVHRLGLLGPDVLATHVAHASAGDRALLAASGTHVVHCGYRKAKEGLTAPLVELLDAGANVVAATDSFSHDFVEGLKLAALLGKIRGRSVGRPSAVEIVGSATWRAAAALGRSDLGRLEPGARGDVTVVDLGGPMAAPVLDPLRAFVYYANGADVRHTLVDGEAVVLEGRVAGADERAVGAAAGAACRRVWELAGDRGLLPAGIRAAVVAGAGATRAVCR